MSSVIAYKIISFYLDNLILKLVSKGVLTELEAKEIQDEAMKFADILTHKTDEPKTEKFLNSITDHTATEEILDKTKSLIRKEE